MLPDGAILHAMVERTVTNGLAQGRNGTFRPAGVDIKFYEHNGEFRAKLRACSGRASLSPPLWIDLSLNEWARLYAQAMRQLTQ